MSLNHFADKALVTFSPDLEDLVTLRIYDGFLRQRLMSFLINRSKLYAVATGKSGCMLDSDLNNFLKVYRMGNKLSFFVYYVRNENEYTGQYEGFTERFRIPVTDILNMLLTNQDLTRVICKNPPRKKAKLELSFNAHQAVAKMSRIERRAFSKAMRDSFYYGESSVFLTTDYDGFYWSQENSFSGGLIRHEHEVKGRDKKLHHCVYYSIHT